MAQVAVGSGVDSLSKASKLHLPCLPLAPKPLNPVSVAAPVIRVIIWDIGTICVIVRTAPQDDLYVSAHRNVATIQ